MNGSRSLPERHHRQRRGREIHRLDARPSGAENHRRRRSLVGGACPNVACLPSKNVIHSAKVKSLVGRAAEFGIELNSARLDMAGVFRRKQAMVDHQAEVHRKLFGDSGG